jgi:hypothetical protein
MKAAQAEVELMVKYIEVGGFVGLVCVLPRQHERNAKNRCNEKNAHHR